MTQPSPPSELWSTLRFAREQTRALRRAFVAPTRHDGAGGERSLLPKGQLLMQLHEQALYLSTHPFGITLGHLVRNRGPIVRIPGLGYIVNDPELGKLVLGDPERFSKTGPGAASALLTPVLGPSALVNMDGAPHRELRDRLRGLFTPRFVNDLVTQVFAQPLAEAQARLLRGDTLDVAWLGQVLTGRMICAMLGIQLPAGSENETCIRLYRTGVKLVSVLTLGGKRLSARNLRFAQEKFEELTREAKADYARGHESTVLGRLRAAGLSFEESKGIAGILLIAGTETTATSMPRITAMLHDTDQWKLVRQQRDLLRPAIDEGLRLAVPVPVMTRSVVQDTELGGLRVRKDERVIMFTYNVNRSSQVLENPLHYDVMRTQPRAIQNLSFGHGPHFCLGFSLAMRELETAFTMLLDAGELRIVKRRYGRHALFAAYSELRVTCRDA